MTHGEIVDLLLDLVNKYNVELEDIRVDNGLISLHYHFRNRSHLPQQGGYSFSWDMTREQVTAAMARSIEMFQPR